jgi:hypothetical protein
LREFPFVTSIERIEDSSEAGRRLVKRDRVERLERFRECVLDRVQGARRELLVRWVELVLVDEPGEILRPLQLLFDEGPVHDRLRLDVRDLRFAPAFNLVYTTIVAGEVFYEEGASKIYIRPNSYNEHATFHNSCSRAGTRSACKVRFGLREPDCASDDPMIRRELNDQMVSISSPFCQ